MISSSCRRHALPKYAAVAFFATLLAARAGAQAPANVSGKEYTLKNTSSFNAPPVDARNPFWPIGWVPAAPVPVAAQTAAPVVEVRADQFTVTSISVDAPALAVINGQTRGIGERILVPGGAAGAQTFVTVKKITDGMVTLDYKGKELVVTPGGVGARRK